MRFLNYLLPLVLLIQVNRAQDDDYEDEQKPVCASTYDCENTKSECINAWGFKHIKQRLTTVARNHCFKKDGSSGERLYCCDTGTPEQQVISKFAVKKGDYPYMAFITGEGACGAAVYNENWLVTAAHCVQNGDTGKIASKITVKVAAEIVNTNFGDLDPIKIYTATKIIRPHKDWFRTKQFDIAVLKLDKPIDSSIMGKYVKALRFPEAGEYPGEPPEGETIKRAVMVGYGVTDLNTTMGVLMGGKLAYTTKSDPDCKKTLKKEKRHICVGGKGGGSVSSGDSGSPVACWDSDEKPYHCGIANFIAGRCFSQISGKCPQLPPAGFADTAHPEVNQWIRLNINEDQDESQLFTRFRSPLYDGPLLGGPDEVIGQNILRNRSGQEF